MGKVLGTVLLVVALLGGATMHGGLVVVDVQEADGPHVVVPVPLAIARAGIALAPGEVQRIEAREFEPFLPHADRVVDALRGASDRTLVEILDGDDHVTVKKEGDVLRLRALEGDETRVEVVVPLRSAEAVVRAYDAEGGFFLTSRLVAALGFAPRGDLVNVADGEDRVRIHRLF